MKSSQFNILTKCPERDEAVLFNSLYGSLTTWNSSEIQTVEHIFDNPDIKDEKVGTILSHLIKGKYIISDDIDEIKIVKNRKIAGMEDNNRLDLVIMPNMTCNFACSYCYESHIPSSFMNDKTEDVIKLWLKDEIPKFKVVLLIWFGGEPLLSYDRIISLSRFIKEICDNCGTELVTNITTNGYLFDENRIKELVSIGIYNYQITVDGPPAIHNKTRSLKNGKDSFWKIYENILRLIKYDSRVNISLRVNFNQHNFSSIPELINIFPVDIRSKMRVIFEPIFGDKCLSATENIPGKEISSNMIKYYHLANKLGYDVSLGKVGTGRLVYCYAERKNQFVINYNGDFFKCSVCSFDSEKKYGYLNSEGKLILNNKQWNTWFGMDEFDEICYSCKYLPVCMGGCRTTRIEHGKTGSYCCLVPTNTSFVLKAVAFENFEEILRGQVV